MSAFYSTVARFYDAENRDKTDDLALYSRLASSTRATSLMSAAAPAAYCSTWRKKVIAYSVSTTILACSRVSKPNSSACRKCARRYLLCKPMFCDTNMSAASILFC